MLSKVLYFLSGTDPEVILNTRCDARSRIQQRLKGLLVLIVGLLAMFSGLEAVLSVVPSFPIALFVGVVYALTIMFLYRSVVSSRSKLAALLAIPLIVAISIVLSAPLELKIFDVRIREEIVKSQLVENEKLLEEREKEIDYMRAKLEMLQQQLIAEVDGRSGTRNPGVGPMYEEKLKIYNDYKAQTERRISELSNERESLVKRGNDLTVQRSGDFLSRWEALQGIEKSSPIAFRAVWAVRLILVVPGLLPILMFLLEADSSYNTLVRKQVNSSNLARLKQRKPVVNSRLPIPGFGHGYASAMDWTGTLATTVEEFRAGGKTSNEIDLVALARDWKVIGSALRRALNKHGAQA